MDHSHMDITVLRVQRHVPVTILEVSGVLDASTYQALITKAQEAYHAGAGNIVLDLHEISQISTCGVVALHSIAKLVRGECPLDPEGGWDVLHAIARDLDSGIQPNVTLLDPQPHVAQAFAQVGLTRFLAVYPDLDSAILALKPNVITHEQTSATLMEAIPHGSPPVCNQPSAPDQGVWAWFRRVIRGRRIGQVQAGEPTSFLRDEPLDDTLRSGSQPAITCWEHEFQNEDVLLGT